MAVIVAETLASGGPGLEFQPKPKVDMNLQVTALAAGSARLERSFDKGITWAPLSLDGIGTVMALTGPASLVFNEPEGGVIYRFNQTSGTGAKYRVSW